MRDEEDWKENDNRTAHIAPDSKQITVPKMGRIQHGVFYLFITLPMTAAGTNSDTGGQGDGFIDEHILAASNSTTPECKGLGVRTQAALNLFEAPLTKEQYYERNWMWLRCRTTVTAEFDAGGSWFGPGGADIKAAFERLNCGMMNWHFKYVNGQGWGDAMFGAEMITTGCNLAELVWAAQDLATVSTDRYKREFYLWDCPGPSDLYHWATERPGQPLPVPGGLVPNDIPDPAPLPPARRPSMPDDGN